MDMSMRATVKIEHRHEVSQKLKASIKKGIQANATVRLIKKAGPEMVDDVLQGLLESGEIEFSGISLDSDESTLDDEMEVDFLKDDDDLPEENRPNDLFRDFSSPFVGTSFDIVATRRKGRIEFDAPENEWTGAVWKTDDAKHVLNEVSHRMRIYSEIAKELEEKFDGRSDAVDGDLCGCLGKEKDFAEKHDVDKGSLSDYLNNARVVCGDRSLPLRKLFR